MKPPVEFRHQFVESVPEKMEGGVVYVSIKYRSVMHLCACGCGSEVVTPLSPADWRLTFDGVSVSLDPSIGNWSLRCRSHYFIRRNNVVWAGDWSDERVAAGRDRDRRNKDLYYGEAEVETKAKAPASLQGRTEAKGGILKRALEFFFGKPGGR